MDPDDLYDGTDYTSESSVNPAEQYLRHDLTIADVALNVTIPDNDELVASNRYGHFADYLANHHYPAEETGGWNHLLHDGPPEETPSAEAEAMHKL